ncbi:MAG: STN domain-containing protein, partial [Cyclobacteriaceae bacterium]|nr:STN domain-containing protein [Cyclobacteriaceae bacterium]
MKSGSFFIQILLSCLLVSAVQGQQNHLFAVNVQNQPFTHLVSELEQKSDYKFFFNSPAVDTLLVTVAAIDQSLAEILSTAFKNTDYRYAIDGNRYVYITIQDVILTELPSDFFDRTGLSSDTLPRKP